MVINLISYIYLTVQKYTTFPFWNVNHKLRLISRYLSVKNTGNKNAIFVENAGVIYETKTTYKLFKNMYKNIY